MGLGRVCTCLATFYAENAAVLVSGAAVIDYSKSVIDYQRVNVNFSLW